MTGQFFSAEKVITLPISRAKVRARRPSTLSLLAAGGFPIEAQQIVWKLFNDGVDPTTLAENPENIIKMATLIEAYLPYVLVAPKIGPDTHVEPDAEGVLTGTLALMDIPDIDKRHLFFFGQGLLEGREEVSAKALESFPAGEPRADARPSREPVRAEAVSPGGDQPGDAVGA